MKKKVKVVLFLLNLPPQRVLLFVSLTIHAFKQYKNGSLGLFSHPVSFLKIKSHEELRKVAWSRTKSCAKWHGVARRVVQSGLKSHEELREVD